LSNKRSEKPPEEPNPGMAGGSKNSTTAPSSFDFSSSSSITSRTERFLFDQFLRLIKQVPAFDPRPSVIISYPANEETDSTSSTSSHIFCSSLETSLVFSNVEPGGV